MDCSEDKQIVLAYPPETKMRLVVVAELVALSDGSFLCLRPGFPFSSAGC